jgi:putative membrane protein
MQRQQSKQSNLWKGLAAGVIGGLAASFVMEQFQALWTKLAEGDQPAQGGRGRQQQNGQQQQSSSGGDEEPANIKAAEAISENLFEHELKKSEKKVAGEAVHYAMGATSGAIYGAMAEVFPVVTAGEGLPFGTAVWLIADDVVVPALGLSKPPTDYPLSTHAYALASHLIYGLTTDLVRRGVRAAL